MLDGKIRSSSLVSDDKKLVKLWAIDNDWSEKHLLDSLKINP